MNILGIDYGERKIGLAVGNTFNKFAEPLSVIKYKDSEKAIKKIDQFAQIERVEKLIVGISEGKSAQDAKEFGDELSKALKLPVEYYDETLSTKEVQRLVIESGMKRKKRKGMEDAFAASLTLQNYLEEI